MIKKFLPLVFLTLLFGVNAFAQRATATPDPVLQVCEQLADKVKRQDIEIESLKAQLGLASERILLRDEQLANAKEQGLFYKQAYEKGLKIDNNSGLVIQNLRDQVADYKLELAGLRTENDKLRNSRDKRMILGFAAGVGTGFLIGK